MRKITINNTPRIFINKDFQTIMIKVMFPFKRQEEKLAMKALLPSMLHSVCKKYPNEKDFFQEQQRLYINSCFCNSSLLIDYGTFNFNFIVPDVYSLGEDLLEEQFKFFHEVIYNPKVENNSFCHKEFDREKNSLLVEVQKSLQDNQRYASIKAKEAFDPDGFFSASIYNHLEQIDLVNEENLYNYYLDMIYNNHPLIYIFGNVEEEKIKKLCNKYLYRTSFNKKEVTIPIHYYFPIREKIKYVEEESSFNNSVLCQYYVVKGMNEKDNVLLGAINMLLSSQSSRLLSKTLRDKHDLVYSCSSNTSNKHGLLTIAVFIQDKNIDFVKKKIKEVLNSLKDEEVVSRYLDLCKDRFRISLIRKLDEKHSLFQDAIFEDLGIDYTDDYYYKELKKITPHDISLFMNRIILDTEYFLKEGNNE